MDTETRVQILDEAVYILHGANTLGKDMNLTNPFQLWANSRADWVFNLSGATGLGKGKLIYL